MKALKDYGIKLPDLKTAVKELNDSGIAERKINTVGVKGEDILVEFIDTIEALDSDKAKEVPETVTKFYDGLPQAVFDDAPPAGEPQEAAPGEAAGGENACPTFGDYKPDEEDCKACVNDFPEEHKACLAATEEKAKKKATKKPAAPREHAKKSRYGHTLNTMSGDIDDMVYVGGHIDDMTLLLAGKYDRKENKARAKIRAHVGYLVKMKGIAVSDKDGVLKSNVEYLKGFDASNTEVVVTSIPVAPKKEASKEASAPATPARGRGKNEAEATKKTTTTRKKAQA